jgi:hypothetical protein
MDLPYHINGHSNLNISRCRCRIGKRVGSNERYDLGPSESVVRLEFGLVLRAQWTKNGHFFFIFYFSTAITRARKTLSIDKWYHSNRISLGYRFVRKNGHFIGQFSRNSPPKIVSECQKCSKMATPTWISHDVDVVLEKGLDQMKGMT